MMVIDHFPESKDGQSENLTVHLHLECEMFRFQRNYLYISSENPVSNLDLGKIMFQNIPLQLAGFDTEFTVSCQTEIMF
jgi:hypothetical protein